MRLQDLNHLDVALETFTACANVDMLFNTLFAHIRDLFHLEAAFVWLAVNGEQSRLYRTEGALAPVAARLQRLKLSMNGDARSQDASTNWVIAPCSPLLFASKARWWV
jgi:hypothetical protein